MILSNKFCSAVDLVYMDNYNTVLVIDDTFVLIVIHFQS
jgi:hypothetical protein